MRNKLLIFITSIMMTSSLMAMEQEKGRGCPTCRPILKFQNVNEEESPFYFSGVQDLGLLIMDYLSYPDLMALLCTSKAMSNDINDPKFWNRFFKKEDLPYKEIATPLICIKNACTVAYKGLFTNPTPAHPYEVLLSWFLAQTLWKDEPTKEMESIQSYSIYKKKNIPNYLTSFSFEKRNCVVTTASYIFSKSKLFEKLHPLNHKRIAFALEEKKWDEPYYPFERIFVSKKLLSAEETAWNHPDLNGIFKVYLMKNKEEQIFSSK